MIVLTDLSEQDFHGQRLTETISTAVLTVSSVRLSVPNLLLRSFIDSSDHYQVIALIIGFIEQDIYLTMWIGLAGTLLAMFLVVPPWPVYNQHPQPWIGSKTRLPPGGIVVTGK